MARILVIDDEDQLRDAVAKILRANGHEVLTSPDGKRALRHFAGDPTDLVVTDVFMPEMDGLDLLARLRETFPETPVIIMTGGGGIDPGVLLRSAQAMGAVQTLAKPFEMEELLAAVRAALEADPG